MIIYKKNALRIGELWFDDEANGEPLDIVRYFQRTAPTADGTWTRFWTILIDLVLDPGVLLGKMKKDARYEIRRAENKDKLTYQVQTEVSDGCLAGFQSFYDAWAAQRLSRVSRLRLLAFAKSGDLTLSRVTDENGDPLVWHAYLRVKDRARLLHSASTLRGLEDTARRSMLGRANRFHHWHDVLTFRAEGLRYYDFGGWYGGRSDRKGLSLNQFKEEFGGEIVLNYNSLKGLTYPGKAAVWFLSHLSPRPGPEAGSTKV